APMGNAVAFRKALTAFLGHERYRKFVKQGLSKGQLRFWQEQEWGRFSAAHPEFSLTPEELIVALRVCWLHGDELLPETVEILEGQVHFADDYVRAKATSFPCSGQAGVRYEGCQTRKVEGWYCPECRRAEATWRSSLE